MRENLNQFDKLDIVLKSKNSDSKAEHVRKMHLAVDLLENMDNLNDDEKWLLVSHLLKRLLLG